MQATGRNQRRKCCTLNVSGKKLACIVLHCAQAHQHGIMVHTTDMLVLTITTVGALQGYGFIKTFTAGSTIILVQRLVVYTCFFRL